MATDELILYPKTKKNKKELEIWQENTRSPEEGKRRGNAREESTDRWTQQEHQRIKHRRRVRTDGHDNNTRRRKPGAVHRPLDKIIKTRRQKPGGVHRPLETENQGVYGPLDIETIPEEKTRRSSRTSGIQQQEAHLTSFWDLWVIVRTTVIIRVMDPLRYLV